MLRSQRDESILKTSFLKHYPVSSVKTLFDTELVADVLSVIVKSQLAINY